MTDRELMQMALDAFEKIVDGCQNVKKANPMHESARDLATFVIVDCKAPIKSISARLAQPEPEELGEVIPADEEQLKRIAKLIEPEPVAWMYEYGTDNGDAVNKVRWYKNVSLTPPVLTYNRDVVPLYTAPPQREWQGLTDEEILEEYRQSYGDDGNLTDVYFAHAIEAKLKEKNG